MTVKLYKNGDNMGIWTDVVDEDAFIDELAAALSEIIQAKTYDSDWEFQLFHWLPSIVDICCAFRGYKNNVAVKTVMSAGTLTVFDGKESIVISFSRRNGEYGQH